MIKKNVSVDIIFQKIKHFCSYQERSHYETREKLYSFGLYKSQVEDILTQLITDDYLNEERFAKAFARGRFRLKQWGRTKIKYELKLRKVSDYNIKTALKEIPADEYTATLQKLADSKWTSLKGGTKLERQAKTTAYLLQKGYEIPLVQQAIETIINGGGAE